MTRVRSCNGTGTHTKLQVSTFMDTKGKRFTITSAGIRTKLRAAVQILGKGRLGFGPMEMRSQSFRSGAAMKMYLVGVSPLTITIIRKMAK